MKTLKHETTYNDLTVESGGFVMLTGVDALKERIRKALQVIKGEWFLDLNLGVNYHKRDRKPSMVLLGAEIKETIAGMTGFKRFLKFTMRQDETRQMIVLFRAEFDEGIIEMEA